MLKKILTAIDTVSEVMGKAFSFLILPVVLLEAFEVVLRYGFDSPTDWSWELAALVSGGMFIMGGAWVLKENRHVRTDVFYAKFSPRGQALIDLIFFALVFFPFVGVMVWKGIDKAIYSVSILEETYSMWAPPLYPLKITIALAFILLCLQGLAKWIRDLHFVIKGHDL
jgi:TRAP-type mannitol/chloroaromatic compound transport system permease small subunit